MDTPVIDLQTLSLPELSVRQYEAESRIAANRAVIAGLERDNALLAEVVALVREDRARRKLGDARSRAHVDSL